MGQFWPSDVGLFVEGTTRGAYMSRNISRSSMNRDSPMVNDTVSRKLVRLAGCLAFAVHGGVAVQGSFHCNVVFVVSQHV